MKVYVMNRKGKKGNTASISVRFYECEKCDMVDFVFRNEALKIASNFHNVYFATENNRLYFFPGNGKGYNISRHGGKNNRLKVSSKNITPALKPFAGDYEKLYFDERKKAYYIERKKDGISKPVKGDEKSIPAHPDPLPEIAQVIKGVLNEIIEERKDEIYSLFKNAIRDGFEEVGK